MASTDVCNEDVVNTVRMSGSFFDEMRDSSTLKHDDEVFYCRFGTGTERATSYHAVLRRSFVPVILRTGPVFIHKN